MGKADVTLAGRAEETVSREKIYDGRMFSVEKHGVKLPDGTEDMRELVINNGGAGIVALDGDGNIILVRQFRYGVRDVLLEIPAGKLEKGEDPRECALRELKEETGFTASYAEPLLFYCASPAYITESVNVYFTDDIRCGDTDPDPGEFVEVIRMPFKKALEMVMRDEIIDGKTKMSIMKTAIIKGYIKEQGEKT